MNLSQNEKCTYYVNLEYRKVDVLVGIELTVNPKRQHYRNDRERDIFV